MSKMAAVDTGVRQQIASDGKTINYGELMSVATGYTTDQDFERFLLGVANRLRLETPPYLFDWSAQDAGRIRQRNLLNVVNLIAEKTKPLEPEKSATDKES